MRKLDALPNPRVKRCCTVEYNPNPDVWPYVDQCQSLADGLIPVEIYVNMPDLSCMRAVCNKHWEELQAFLDCLTR